MSRKKILVIDDNPVIVRLNESLLNSGGYEVISAGDGLEGIKKAQDERPDAILLDLVLPGKHGFEVCKELKADERTRSIPIVILTGTGLEEVAESEPDVPADGYLAKPFDFQKLDTALKDAMAKAGGS